MTAESKRAESLAETQSGSEMADRRTARGIVVGVDGSPWATMAVRWAAHESVMRNAALTLVHVLTTPVASRLGWTFSTAPLPAEFGEWQQDDQARQLIDEAISVVEDNARDSGGVKVEAEVLSAGEVFTSAIPALVEVSAEAQMIVVGSRGQGGALVRGLLGSVSSGLVHHARCPVAVIHDDAAELESSQAPVLVGIDGSPASELATCIAFDEASWRGVDLVALHAWSDVVVPDFPGVNWSAIESNAEETLAEWLAGWHNRHPDVTVRPVVVRHQPARHLLAQSEDAQLVVVGSRGRGGFAGMLLGSVSTAVVHAARTPVIVARHP